MTSRETQALPSAKMLIFAILCTGAIAAAQSADREKPTPKKASQPVLIIHSDCAQKLPGKGPRQGCKTVVTKKEFDTLVTALDSRMPDSNRLILAGEYVKLLVMQREAQKLKLDQDPAFRELVEFTRLQLLERQLVRHLEQESSTISRDEIAAFYQQRPSNFQEGSLRKIFIPKQGQWSSVEAVRAIQQRAANGEDFDKLQQEVWTAQGRPAGAPLTRIGTVRRSTMADPDQKAFELNPGEVSAPIEEVGGYAIFKLESKRVLPLESVEDEIRNAMASQRLQERLSQLRSAVSISVNEDYFGTLPSTQELAQHHGLEHAGSHMMPMTQQEKNER